MASNTVPSANSQSSRPIMTQSTQDSAHLSAATYQPTNIMVTGGAGYIGSHFCDWFLKQNATGKVMIVDDLSFGNPQAVEVLQKRYPGRVAFYNKAVSDPELVDLLKAHHIQGVIHYAGKISVPESEANPALYWDGNTAETIKLIHSLTKANINTMVFSSTAATYGQPKTVPIQETDPTLPINTYGRSKLMVEHIMNDMHQHKTKDGKPQLNYIALRYFNVAGASDDASLGEAHQVEEHIIPRFIHRLRDKLPVSVFGNDYQTADGTCVRDYIDVRDLADAHLKALNKVYQAANDPQHSQTGLAESINLGTSNGVSNLQILDALKAVWAKLHPEHTPDFKFEPRRPGDPDTLIASNKKALDLLGWTPGQSLESTIEAAVKWELKGRFADAKTPVTAGK
jgi:UDP-glucose 4-epimerase